MQAALLSPRSTVHFAGACRRAFHGLRSGYPHYLPGIASTWFFTEVVSQAVPGPRAVAAPLLFFLSAVYYAAGAARTAGRFPTRNVIMLGVERSSSFLSMFGLLIAALGLGALLVGVPAIAAGTELLVGVGMAVWAALLGLGFLRFWPTPAIAFHFQGRIRWSPSGRGSLWVGPGLGAAWRLTSRIGTVRRASLPLAGLVLLVGGGWLAGRLLADLSGFALFAFNAAFFAGALPFLYGLVDDLTGQLRAAIPEAEVDVAKDSTR